MAAPSKKAIMHRMVKAVKKVKTRNNVDPLVKGKLPDDPMRTLSPVPGNAMHIGNTDKNYQN